MEDYETCPKCNTNKKHKGKYVCNSCAKPQWLQARKYKFKLRDMKK